MRQSYCTIVIAILVLVIGSSAARGGVAAVTFGGDAGVYTLPKEISGYIDGNASTYNRYIWAESGKDQYGYIEKTYKYKHPFPLRTLPNTGVHFGVSYNFPSRLGVFLEGCRTFSIRDKTISQNVPDSLAGDEYAIIPHDYRIRSTESDDRLYMKSFQFGLGLSYTMPLKHKVKLIIAGSFGGAYYSQYFRVETSSITTDYYQNDGHLVYSETNDQGSFEVFGIRYSTYCFKPAVAAEWGLKPPLSVRIGLAYPISVIEKGVHFTESSSYDDDSDTYYPANRFWAGNVVLSAGVSLNFGKGDNQ